MIFYVYEWYKTETNEVIYVGKGCRTRYKVRKHNNLFNYIVNHCNCESRIIKYFEKEQDAFDYEFIRINELKRTKQCICNIKKGGNGGVVTWWDAETRERYSKNNVMKSVTQRERMAKNNPMKNATIAAKVGRQHRKPITFNGERYGSAIILAEKLGVTPTLISAWAKRGFSSNGTSCFYSANGEPKGWQEKYKAMRMPKGKPVYIGNTLFNTVKEAATYLGITSAALIYILKHNKKYKNHICKYANQQPSHENSDKSIVEGSTTNK